MQDQHRSLEETEDPPLWEAVFTVIVLIITFSTLILDRFGTDSIMLTALTAFYLARIIDIKEALSGFSNSGLLTVLVLFVVAEGLNKTGALNWYVGKLFGTPSTPAGAQIRVMAPIAALSGFINDTPLVVMALPVLIQWAKRLKVPLRLILMPLSFAALLGGVNTIMGTSTNLIVVGLLTSMYPDEERFQNLSLFALTPYGVPVTFMGLAYVVLMSPLLLMRMDRRGEASISEGDILLGARLTQWSPAAGRSIKRSGLRETGGIYLVSVKRRATGNLHTAVSPEFVLEVGDILYFTGLIDTFGEFCEDHGLEGK
jgi:di/tricarboxylate transporter